MIFVAVSGWPFERLIKKMDQIANKTKEKIIMQIGDTRYKPKYAQYFRFIPRHKMEEYTEKARIVVSHGGEGCIITALQFKKPLVVVPRYKKFNEHINNHQLDLTRVLEKEKKIVAVYDIDNLEKAIKSIRKTIKANGKKERLIEFIKKYIEEQESDRNEHSNYK